MWTLLFDIDGTLIRTRGAGFAAIGRVMKEMFGIESFPEVGVHGRTDFAIVSEIFASAELEVSDHIEPFYRKYWEYLPAALAANEQAEILPGVNQLLETLHDDERFSVGLLTGNAEVPALIKMEHFGLRHYFSFGGYGDTTSCRNEVAGLAIESARSHIGDQFDASRVWVIGDTLADITCARSIDSRVVAVETGGASRGELAGAGPDIQLPTMTDYRSLIEQLVR